MIVKPIGQILGHYWSNLNKGASHSDEIFLQFRGHSIPFEARLKGTDHETLQLMFRACLYFSLPPDNISKQYVNITDGGLIIQTVNAFQFEIDEWKGSL
ncbi:hypothetical protein TCAL_15122 [Tigriopus californicus]|uniref:Uncharacterized protein n=1 Tax=Tigriopus californicus TaxID=6832 RepID=A0A553NTT5_TIGCA|nr:hypothetical protein TCAL_15122 [Tigriopus californicus]